MKKHGSLLKVKLFVTPSVVDTLVKTEKEFVRRKNICNDISQDSWCLHAGLKEKRKLRTLFLEERTHFRPFKLSKTSHTHNHKKIPRLSKAAWSLKNLFARKSLREKKSPALKPWRLYVRVRMKIGIMLRLLLCTLSTSILYTCCYSMMTL